VETEKVWQYADEYDLAKIIFVNKMDKERADFYRALADIEKAFKVKPLPNIFTNLVRKKTSEA